MISAISPSTGGATDSDLSETGIAQKHVYTVLSAFKYDQGGSTLKLYRIRNPWGQGEKYTGPYNDDDASRWDPDLQAAVGWEDKDDGTFFIDHESYHEQFASTQIATDNSDMQHTYYLVKDDDQASGTKHEFTLTSLEDQTVYLSAHTWPVRTHPRDCIVKDGYYAGAAAARHEFQFESQNTDTRYPGDDIRWLFKDSHNVNGI